MELQAWVWYQQDWLEEAKPEALRVTDVCERHGKSTPRTGRYQQIDPLAVYPAEG